MPPIGLIALLLIVIAALRKGVDTPQMALAAVMGDESDGTALEGPVDMAGGIVSWLWSQVARAWESESAMSTAVDLATIAGVWT